VVSFTPRPLYPRERAPGTHCMGGCVDPRAGLDEMEKWKFLTLPGLEPRPLSLQARSQSLYRLRYPGSSNLLINFIYAYSSPHLTRHYIISATGTRSRNNLRYRKYTIKLVHHRAAYLCSYYKESVCIKIGHKSENKMVNKFIHRKLS
jgi:hypothetical protein